MAFVRSSKFRHVFGKKFATEHSFTNVTLTGESFDGVMITANSKFLAFVVRTEGGGAFMVLPIEQYGRIDQNAPKVEGHGSKVLTLAWNPFNDNIIASGDDRGLIKIFEIPVDGLKETLRKEVVELNGHQRKVQLLTWHCSAENILFSASADNDIALWNLETAEMVASCTFPSFLYSISLNHNGSEMAVSCKDKKFRVLDARTFETKLEWEGHEGSKPQFIQYANFDMFITTGFSRMSERELGAWTQKGKELTIMELDTSNSPLHIYYDVELNIMFLTGKGDSCIRYYELDKNKPYLHFLSTQNDSSGHQRIGSLCKRAVNPTTKEIFRFYRYEPKQNITVMSMIVPRKSDTFQDDIYPDTASDEPALTATEWLGGKNSDPKKMSFQASYDSAGKASTTSTTTKKAGIGLRKSSAKAASGEGGEDEFTALKKEVATLKSTVQKLEERIKSLERK